MKIIAVDDNTLDLYELMNAIKKACPDGKVCGFSKAKEAVKYIKENTVDVALIETVINGEKSYELVNRLKQRNELVNVIFVTKDDSYALEAYNIPASGYVLKPITTEAVIKELGYLRYPVLLT